MSNESIISFNVQNWITVSIIAFLSFFIVAAISKAVKARSASAE